MAAGVNASLIEALRLSSGLARPRSIQQKLRQGIELAGQLVNTVGNGATVVQRVQIHLQKVATKLNKSVVTVLGTVDMPQWYISAETEILKTSTWHNLDIDERLRVMHSAANRIEANIPEQGKLADELRDILEWLDRLIEAVSQGRAPGHRQLDEIEAACQPTYRRRTAAT